MKRVVLAAVAALGTVCAGSASADPIRVYGTGVITNKTTGFLPDQTSVALNDPFSFNFTFERTGTIPGDPSILTSGGSYSLTGVDFPTGVQGAGNPVVNVTPNSFNVNFPAANLILNAGTTTTSSVGLTQGAVPDLSGSYFTYDLFFFGAQSTQAVDYTGYLTSLNTVSAIPEASAWAMMMVGLGVVGGALRRRPTQSVRFA